MTEDNAAAWGSMRAMLLPGDLLVARGVLAALVMRASSPEHEAVFDRLVELCAGPAQGGSGRFGANLLRQADGLVASGELEEAPDFALVTTASVGLLVMVSGDLRVLITPRDGAAFELDGTDSVLPVTRVLRDFPARLAIAPDLTEVQPERRSNLVGGVVRAGGLVLESSTAPGAEAAGGSEAADDREVLGRLDTSVADPTPAPSFMTFSLYDDAAEGFSEPAPTDAPVETTVVGAMPPVPVAAVSTPAGSPAAEPRTESPRAEPDTAAGSPPVASPPLVRGIVCSRGHFNAPDARFCAHCGVSMVQQTHNVVIGLRPPLGVLIADDGGRYPLVDDAVIGRDPESSEAVRSGRATAVVLDDPELSLSRVHALVILDGWEVRLEDAGSANGTFVAPEGSDDWRPLAPGVATTITPGTRLRLGSRVLTYESHHRS